MVAKGAATARHGSGGRRSRCRRHKYIVWRLEMGALYKQEQPADRVWGADPHILGCRQLCPFPARVAAQSLCVLPAPGKGAADCHDPLQALLLDRGRHCQAVTPLHGSAVSNKQDNGVWKCFVGCPLVQLRILRRFDRRLKYNILFVP